MGKDYGEPIRHDPDFDGPVRNRSCTDIFWLILFIVGLGGWGYIGYYSIKNGNVEVLLAPLDSKGRRCGYDSGLENKKYLLFFDIAKCLSPGTPLSGCPTTQLCVERCPQETILFKQLMSPQTFPTLKQKMICQEEIDIASMTYDQAVQYMNQEKCTSYIIESQPVLGRCFVNVTRAMDVIQDMADLAGLTEQQVLDQLTNLIRFNELSSQIVQDLVQSRWYMLGALVAVVVLCFLYILILRWVVTPLVWLTIAGFLALLVFISYLCYKNYVYYKANPVTLQQTTNLAGYTMSWFTKHQTWLAMLIIVAVITIMLFLIIIFLRNRIGVAISLIKEGSRAVMAVKSTMFFPLFPWVLQCAVMGYGLFVFLSLMSIGEPGFKTVNLQEDSNCNCQGHYNASYIPCEPATFSRYCQDVSAGYPKPCRAAVCHFTGIENPRSYIYLQLLNILIFFWTMFFISGVADMILASTFSTWYFRRRDLPFFTLTQGIFRTVRYHLGTVAFGALIIAIVRVIRVILEYINRKVKRYANNPVSQCIMCCCRCFFLCLENFLKFVNKNAYIMCAIHGTSFCKSARDAMSLLMRNIVRVAVLDKVTDFLFFLSKLFISIGVGVAVYYLLQWNYVYEVTQSARLHYNYIPAIILSVATYLIASIFFNVYSMAVDTLFLCFLEDWEASDGHEGRRNHMSKNLMKVFSEKKKPT